MAGFSWGPSGAVKEPQAAVTDGLSAWGMWESRTKKWCRLGVTTASETAVARCHSTVNQRGG